MIVKESEADFFNCHYPDATHCVGSHCMAWRWAIEDNPNFSAHKFPDPKDNAPFIRSKTHGYCGLAGQP